jgi:WD40 repeat protein/tRNA A-37 threonylcarbamoyl transferase component Bud32
MADDGLLEELLSQWQRDAAQGRDSTATELCRDHPELAAELERRIRAARRRDDQAGQADDTYATVAPSDAVAAIALDSYATQSGTVSLALDGPPSVGGLSIPGYEILSTLGRGGMGVVYKARQVKLDRIVALKMILSGAHAGPDELARFRTEAEAIARLQHPNIVQVHEVGEHEGKPFFSLEFCAGGTLDRKLAGTPLRPLEAARFLETLAWAMHAAHQANVIHRDLKPANVLLTADGTPKITDFGLAKKLGEAGRTATGDVMGTPSYMAPEQAGGKSKEVAPATDVYALGAILYELLTGRPPFKAATPLDTIMQVVSDEPVPPSRVQSNTPRDLQTICLKCLQKEPARRYPSAAALAEDLERFLRGEPIQARPAGRVERLVKWARRRPAVAGFLAVSVLAVLVVLGGLVFFTSRLNQRNRDLGEALKRAEDETDAKVLEANAKDQALNVAKKARDDAEAARRDTQRNLYFAEMNLASQAAQSPGGGSDMLRELLSHWRPARGNPDQRGWEWYYLRSFLPQPQLTLHRHRDAVKEVCWSPDGKRLASASYDRTVMLWDAQTGQLLRTLRGHEKPIWTVGWCSDGRILASGDEAGVVQLWDTETGKPIRQLRHGAPVRGVSLSPNGSQLASAGEGGKVKVWDTHDGELRFALPGAALIRFVRFSPDGRRLAAGDSNGMIHVWDLATRKLVRSPWRSGAGWVAGLSWSPDGQRLASATADALPPVITIWDPVSGRQLMSPLTGHAQGLWGVDWSPDGRYLASGAGDQTARIWDAKTGRTLLTLQGHTGLPVASWSPDSTRLAVCGDQMVKVWDVAGLLTPSPPLGDAIPPISALRWSPDSQVLALGSRNGVVSLWDVSAGRQTATLSGQALSVWALAWSPDGRRLAVSSNLPAICIWDVSKKQVIATLNGHRAGVTCLTWARDGRRLASASHDRTVRVWDVDRQAALARFEGHSGAVYVVCWGPDDRQLVSSSAENSIRIWDFETRRQVQSLNTKSWVYGLGWCRQNAQLASVYFGQMIKLWDTQSKRESAVLRGHTHGIMAIAWRRDGQRLASGARDNTVRIWDPEAGRQTVSLNAHKQHMGALDWSPDGRWLASASEYDWKVRLWDALPGYLAERSPLALPELNRRLRINPKSVSDLLLRAEVYARAGKWQEAAADWNEGERVQRGSHPWFLGGWWVAGPFPATFDAADETATDVDPVTQPSEAPGSGKSSALRWQLANASSDGSLDLSALLPHRKEKECAYVVVRVYSPRDEVATARLDCTGDIRLHVNGAVVKEIKASVTLTEDQAVAVTLREGWNTLLFRVDIGDRQDQLRMWLTRR